jgi:hypothetical protein
MEIWDQIPFPESPLLQRFQLGYSISDDQIDHPFGIQAFKLFINHLFCF